MQTEGASRRAPDVVSRITFAVASGCTTSGSVTGTGNDGLRLITKISKLTKTTKLQLGLPDYAHGFLVILVVYVICVILPSGRDMFVQFL